MLLVVTGGAGFLGQHLVEYFAAREARVRSLDLLPHGFPHLPSVKSVCADVRDVAVVNSAIAGCDVVVHNAAFVPITRSGSQFWQVNVEGTRNVLEASQRHGVRKVVHISSSAVYGRPKQSPLDENAPLNPMGAYGKSKAAAEALCRQFRDRELDVSILRPRPILGPRRLGVLEVLFERIRRGKPFFVLGDGANRFQLVSVYDVTEAAYLLSTVACRNEDFNIGAERFGTLREELEALARHAGTESRIVSVPEAPVRAALRLLDMLALSPFVSWHYETISSDFWYSAAKLERVLRWKPRFGNIDMLYDSYDWYVANHDAITADRRSAHTGKLRSSLLGEVLKRI